ncbi:MAG: protein phosphatase CheZ [Deltaproteobacteria bacterium]|jgi:chemotaxis regulatin CheY-phosphate phosphatase CheZ|nr:protein phosphatase CheZ [Deltaproteobacteria bacterium]
MAIEGFSGGVVEKYAALQRELVLMVEYINDTRKTLGGVTGKLPGASDVLTGVTQALERATHEILGMVEKVMDLDAKSNEAVARARAAAERAGDADAVAALDEATAASDERMAVLTEIMTTLSFQDLTCQAINRIGGTVLEVENRVRALVERRAPGMAGDTSESAAVPALERLKEAHNGQGKQGLVDELLRGR